MPASAPHARATTSPLAAINSSMLTKCCPASSMAANTSGLMIDPPRAVTQLRALITFVTPSRSYMSGPFIFFPPNFAAIGNADSTRPAVILVDNCTLARIPRRLARRAFRGVVVFHAGSAEQRESPTQFDLSGLRRSTNVLLPVSPTRPARVFGGPKGWFEYGAVR